MDRISAGLVIAATVVMPNVGIFREARAEPLPRKWLSHGPSVDRPQPANDEASGFRSARVLSLLLTLEALRTAPDLVDADMRH
jgi:hypothetical protein